MMSPARGRTMGAWMRARLDISQWRKSLIIYLIWTCWLIDVGKEGEEEESRVKPVFLL